MPIDLIQVLLDTLEKMETAEDWRADDPAMMHLRHEITELIVKLPDSKRVRVASQRYTKKSDGRLIRD